MFKKLLGLAAVCVVLPVSAHAATWTLNFTGPQAAQFVIQDLYGLPYVSSFSATGANGYGAVPNAVPHNWNTTLPDTPANGGIMSHPSLLSKVTLSDTGGQISIYPGTFYDGYYDGFLNINLTYTLSSEEAVGSTFSNEPVTGNYTYSYYVNATGYGSDHDFSANGSGRLTSLSASGPSLGAVPEPSEWALAITGFAMLGVAIRLRRAERQSLQASL